MKDMDTKQQYIELRAKGLSYASIAKQIGVSRQPLFRWKDDFSLEREVNELISIKRDVLQEQYRLFRNIRFEIMADILQKLKKEISTRDFSKLPEDKLVAMAIASINNTREPGKNRDW